jgi:hypothetical protein
MVKRNFRDRGPYHTYSLQIVSKKPITAVTPASSTLPALSATSTRPIPSFGQRHPSSPKSVVPPLSISPTLPSLQRHRCRRHPAMPTPSAVPQHARSPSRRIGRLSTTILRLHRSAPGALWKYGGYLIVICRVLYSTSLSWESKHDV